GLLKSEYIFTSAFSLVWSGIMTRSLIAFRVPIISNDGATRGLRLELIEAIRSRGFFMRATPQRRCACWWQIGPLNFSASRKQYRDVHCILIARGRYDVWRTRDGSLACFSSHEYCSMVEVHCSN